jgi:hypothetical protein
MRRSLILLFLVAAVAAGGVVLWRSWRRLPAAGPVAAVAPGTEVVEVFVYYPPRAGMEPVEEVRQRPKPASPQDALVQLVAELHAPPASPAALPLFPPGLVSRAVFLSADGVAYLDETAKAFDRPLGPRDEFLFLRSVMRSIAKNCPDVKAAVFLVDGSTRPQLCAHLPAHGRYLIPKLVPARGR